MQGPPRHLFGCPSCSPPSPLCLPLSCLPRTRAHGRRYGARVTASHGSTTWCGPESGILNSKWIAREHGGNVLAASNVCMCLTVWWDHMVRMSHVPVGASSIAVELSRAQRIPRRRPPICVSVSCILAAYGGRASVLSTVGHGSPSADRAQLERTPSARSASARPPHAHELLSPPASPVEPMMSVAGETSPRHVSPHVETLPTMMWSQ